MNYFICWQQISKFKEQIDLLINENNAKSAELVAVREENEILRNNISSLYNTSKADTQKKLYMLKGMQTK